jgi:enamine deaminase RidA (YjgF/YER057c/UK114 family)
MTIREKMAQLGLQLPPAVKPVGKYAPAVRAGNLVFTSGQLPVREGTLLLTGKVPGDVPMAEAQQCAAQACLNALAAIEALLGNLDGIEQIVRLNVFVNSSPGFVEQAKVANGASELLNQIFGQAGVHTRCAIGAAELPLHSPVELDLVVQIK